MKSPTHSFHDGQDYPGGAEKAVLPEHLGGYQHLADHVIAQEGDIWVHSGKPSGFVDGPAIGQRVGLLEGLGYNIYRLIPCPRQGGDRALTADEQANLKRVQAELAKRADHQMSEPPAVYPNVPWDSKPGVIVARALGCNALPQDPKARKGIPIATGFVDYFPKAIAAVARLSQIGNDQHNPGSPLHWDRSKSGDEADAQMRHFIERGKLDSDGVPHDVKNAWRAMAGLEKYLEKNPWP